MSSTFGSNLVIPIIKIDIKCSCDSEVRFLDLTYFSELQHSKEAVKSFLVAFYRTLALQKAVTGGCSKILRISTSRVI